MGLKKLKDAYRELKAEIAEDNERIKKDRAKTARKAEQQDTTQAAATTAATTAGNIANSIATD